MTTTSVLNADRVQEIFLACCLKDEDDYSAFVLGPGITSSVGFHSGRVEAHKAEIAAMLDELPEKFKESGGGGMSFLNACTDRYGNQWTGLHERMEQLFQLGIAAGKAACLLPRDRWDLLPGGMPYYVVHDDFKAEEFERD